MGILRSSIRVTEDLAAAATSAAGAIAGAAAGGAVGAVGGTVRGVSEGLGLGSRSLPAAVLTIGAVGATGLVDWPVLMAVGGSALLLRHLRNASPGSSEAPMMSTPNARNRNTSPPSKRTNKVMAKRAPRTPASTGKATATKSTPTRRRSS